MSENVIVRLGWEAMSELRHEIRRLRIKPARMRL